MGKFNAAQRIYDPSGMNTRTHRDDARNSLHIAYQGYMDLPQKSKSFLNYP
jgi:hypothetical protein